MRAMLIDRIKNDFFADSQISKYKEILLYAKENEYQMVSIYDYYTIQKAGKAKGKRLLVNRHDVDNSPRNAAKMAAIEKEVYKNSGFSTYYFRLSTYTPELMRQLFQKGFEVGYHYEEIADYSKKNKIKNPDIVLRNISTIQNIFLNNLQKFRHSAGIEVKTCASHGDFVNRLLKIANTELLKDETVRKRAGIVVEAYDDIIEGTIDCRFSDATPIDQLIESFKRSVDNKEPIILLLTHPGHWEVDIIRNIEKNIVRMWQGLAYLL